VQKATPIATIITAGKITNENAATATKMRKRQKNNLKVKQKDMDVQCAEGTNTQKIVSNCRST
jgi:hypothetical protein